MINLSATDVQPSYGATRELDGVRIYKLIIPECRHSCIIVSSRARLKAILNTSTTFSRWGTREIQLPSWRGRVINIFDDVPSALPMRARSAPPPLRARETHRNLINHAT